MPITKPIPALIGQYWVTCPPLNPGVKLFHATPPTPKPRFLNKTPLIWMENNYILFTNFKLKFNISFYYDCKNKPQYH